MSSVTGRGEHAWWLAAAVCGLIGYQVLAYRALAQGAAGSWVALVPLLAAVGLTWRTRLRWPLVVLAAAAGIWLWTRPAGVAGALLAVHLSVHLALLWMFARTLRRGREPLVTGIARRVRGDLPPEVARYTRRVTAAWCAFFAGMAATSLLLFLFAPLPVWSLFANLLSLPLVVSMFVAEYLVRITHLRHLRHFPITAAVRAFRQRTGTRDAPPG
jgi:uncharacterized membrane protein